MSQNTHNVRTRREQLSTYPESVCVGRYSGDTWQLELDADDLDADRLVEGPVLYVRCDIAHQSQKEAEARGAAEQRGKDAEGCAIAGYVPDNTPNFFSASEARHASTALHRDPFPGDVPVYYTPAYVAWREERVKALEETLRRIADSEVFCGSQTLRHMARAALTREGGV